MQADLFILLDHVQFERRNYQNRTRILLDGQPHWLTVPVLQMSQKERVLDKQIDNPPEETLRWWGTNHYLTLRHAYRQAPFFDLYGPDLKKILESRWNKLVDLNHALLDFLRHALDIRTPVVRSSQLNVSGEKSELILNLCQFAGADVYLAGMGGSRDYLDQNAFNRAGIQLQWQNFQHPVYRQCGHDLFVPGLSALDMLFNYGPQSRNMMQGEMTKTPARQLEVA